MSDAPIQSASRRASQSEGGFVLPLVLVTVAMVGLALWSAVSVLDLTTRNVRALRDDVDLEIASASIEARLGYVVAVEPTGPTGLRIGGVRITREQLVGLTAINADDFRRSASDHLYMDGRPYLLPETPDWPQDLPGDVRVSLQDRGGLLNLNTLDEATLDRGLQAIGVDRRNSRTLAATLADYTDTDIFRRLEGAEKDVYARQGLPAPPDAPLRRLTEAFGALGWNDQMSPEHRAALARLAYAGPRFSPMNVNTAPPTVLMAWFGLDERQTLQAVKLRENNPFLTLFDFNASVGINVPFNELNNYTRPADTARLSIERPGARCRVRQVWLSHAQSGASQPLFFTGREDMSCPPVMRGLDPEPSEPITIPVGGSRAAQGIGRPDSSRR